MQTNRRKAEKAVETFEAHEPEVACDGGQMGHPRVYLHIERESGRVTCPYCSRTYVLKGAFRRAAH